MKIRQKKSVAMVLFVCILASLLNIQPAAHAEIDSAYYRQKWNEKNHFTVIPTSVTLNFIWDGNNSQAMNNGNPCIDPRAMPQQNGSGVYEVYSVQQLRYVLLKDNRGVAQIRIMQDLDFGGYNWLPISFQNEKLLLDGNNKVFYNFKCVTTGKLASSLDYSHACFLRELKNAGNYIHDFTFKNISLEENVSGGVFTDWGGAVVFAEFLGGTLKNVGVEDGLFASKHRWAYGLVFMSHDIVWPDDPVGGHITIQDCYTKNITCFAEGRPDKNGSYESLGRFACASAFLGGGAAKGATIERCYTAGSTVITLEGHAGGFSTCTSGELTYSECFSDVTVYGGDMSAGFQGPMHTGKYQFQDCYSMGSVDGTNVVGGFAVGYSFPNKNLKWNAEAKFNRCYSSAIVGMLENGDNVGSFMGIPVYEADQNTLVSNKINFVDCYAVGESGGIGGIIDSQNKPLKKVGGFMGSDFYSGIYNGNNYSLYLNDSNFTNCYYDKQTTAARVWATGTKKDQSATLSTKDDMNLVTKSAIRGVLTTTTNKSGFGLASGDPVGQIKGFTGFSDNTKWSFTKGRYPQLAAFQNPSYAWQPKHVNLVKACSQASVSTVHLTTWDDLPVETYDTVRDLTLRFPLTSQPNLGWQKIADPYGKGTLGAIDLQKIADTWYGINLQPGITWIEVTATENGTPGKRRLRVIPLASLDAGPDMVWKTGETRKHYTDLIMQYSTAQRLSVNIHDITTGGYPVSDPPVYIDAETSHVAPKDINFTPPKISRITATGIRVNPSTIIPVIRHVDREAGDLKLGTAAAEADGWNRMFAGLIPVENKHSGVYIFDYKWKLTDDRYLQDYKKITIRKAAKAVLEVRDSGGNLISNAMYLNLVHQLIGAFTFSAALPSAQETKPFVPAGTETLFAWKPADAQMEIEKVVVTVGTQTKESANPQAGTTFTHSATGYIDLYLTGDTYSITPVTAEIQRQIQQKNGAYVLGFLGKQTIGGVEYMDFEDDVTVVVYVKTENMVKLHLRQQVLGALPPTLALPRTGYFRLNYVTPALPLAALPQDALQVVSGSDIPPQPDFTEYTLLIPLNKKAVRIDPVVPQYYNYAGFMKTNTYQQHDPSLRSLGMIVADYSGADRAYWVTVYLQAKAMEPADHVTEMKPNEFQPLPSLPPTP